MKFFKKLKKILPVAVLSLVVILAGVFYFLYIMAVKASLTENLSDFSKTFNMVWIVSAIATLLIIFVFAALVFVLQKISAYFTNKMYCDGLTGISNTEMLSKFYEGLGENATIYAYVYLNVDNFKQINDTFGYDAGNQLLKDIANILKQSRGENEVVCRTKGDIFALLLKLENREQFCERLSLIITRLKGIRIKNENSEFAYACNYSCGVCEINSNNFSFDTIANMATVACSVIDHENGVDFAFFDEKMNSTIQYKSRLLASVKEAMAKKEILPYLLPKHEMKERGIIGAKLVEHWEHPEFGVVESNEIISVLELSGNILELDLYMIEEACKLLKKWIDEECMPVPLSVNISKFNIYDANFIDRVTAIISQYDVTPSLIDLAIDSNSILGHEEKTLEFANILKGYGFSISLDSFGKDEVAINLLYGLPITFLGFDKDFISKAGESKTMQEVLRSTISLARHLGITACAEYIETTPQDALLSQLKCDVAYGTLYSKPQPGEDFEKLIF